MASGTKIQTIGTARTWGVPAVILVVLSVLLPKGLVAPISLPLELPPGCQAGLALRSRAATWGAGVRGAGVRRAGVRRAGVRRPGVRRAGVPRNLLLLLPPESQLLLPVILGLGGLLLPLHGDGLVLLE